MLFDTLAFISLLIIIMLLRRLVNIFPSLLACTMRWKENVNLEMSLKLSWDRNILATAMIVPFCLVVYKFRIYNPGFISEMNDTAAMGTTTGIFLSFLLLRFLLNHLLRPRKMRISAYKAANAASRTFFIILTLSLLATGGILSFIHTDANTIKSAMIWISAVIYLVSVFRKIQIFYSSYNFLTVFLYLCALEIVPTVVLVTSAMIF